MTGPGRDWRRERKAVRAAVRRNRPAIAAGVLTALIATTLVLGSLSRVADPYWRVTTFISVKDPRGTTRAPVEIGRDAVRSLSSDNVQRDVARRLGLTPTAVDEKSFQMVSDAAWTRVVTQYDGASVSEAITLRDATTRAAAPALAGLSVTTRGTNVGRITPPMPLMLLAACAFVIGAGATVGFAVSALTSARDRERTRPLPQTLVTIATLILLTATFASPLVSQRPSRFSLLIAGSIVLGIATALLTRRPAIRQLTIPALSLLVGAFGCYSLISWATGGTSGAQVDLGASVQERIFPSQFAHPAHYGAAVAILIPFALVGLQGTRSKVVAAAYALAAALGTVALVLTFARSAWLAFAVSVFVVLDSWRARAVALVGGLVVGLPFAGLIAERVTGADYSGDARLGIWPQAVDMIREHPLTGVGVRNFAFAAGPMDDTFSAAQPPHAHNLLLNTAAELGVPTAIALFTLLCVLLSGQFRGTPRSPGDASCARACAGAIVALLITGLTDVAAYQHYTVPLTAVVLGIAAASARSPTNAEDGDTVHDAAPLKGAHQSGDNASRAPAPHSTVSGMGPRRA